MGGLPSNPKFSMPISRVGPTTTHIITAAAALRLGNAVLHRRSLRLGFLLHSSLKIISRLGDVLQFKDIWYKKALQITTCNGFQWSHNALPFLSLCFFNGDENRSDSKDIRKSYSDTSRRVLFDGRQWTNILLAANVLVYIAQTLTDGKLLFWGAKINSLIDQGQLWRLATSSFLHANIGHLMVNCYSLNSVGPTVEKICGPRRYLTIYITSAIAGTGVSYWFSKAPAIGASGAIFGLVGSFAMFVMRHRGMVKGTDGHLQHLAQVVVLNMAIGLLSKGIDNWGHVGGLIGGVAVTWLLGPAWKAESVSRNGRSISPRKEVEEAENHMKKTEDYLDSVMESAVEEYRVFEEEMNRMAMAEHDTLVNEAKSARRRCKSLEKASTFSSNKYIEAAAKSASSSMKTALEAVSSNSKKIHPS